MKQLILLLLLVIFSPVFAESKEVDDFDLLLSSLLNINQDRYTYVNSQGKKELDSLRLYKKNAAVYMKYLKPDLLDGRHSEKRLKVFLLIAFIADSHKYGATRQALADHLVPIYNKNRKSFLKSLKELAFMIPATCRRLNSHFGHEGKNADKRIPFIEQNTDIINSILNTKDAQVCLEELNKDYYKLP